MSTLIPFKNKPKNTLKTTIIIQVDVKTSLEVQEYIETVRNWIHESLTDMYNPLFPVVKENIIVGAYDPTLPFEDEDE